MQKTVKQLNIFQKKLDSPESCRQTYRKIFISLHFESRNIISTQHFPEQNVKRKNTINYNTENIIKDLMNALEKAINDENYEIAAKLRDRIKNLKTRQIN